MNPAPSLPLTTFPDHTLGRLPYDAWHECIRFAAMQSVEGPLPFLAVSPSWEESIIASPQLWTTIFFNGGEDEEARSQTFSHLSQDLPLYLVYLYPYDGKVVERFISSHRLRIQSIEDGAKYQDFPDLSILRAITTSLPALRYLDSNSYHISEGILLNCVNLRVINWPKIRIADETCLGLHVESIRVADIEPDKIAKLTHRTNIRALELDLFHRGSERLWNETPTDAIKTQMANLFTKIGQYLSNLTLTISFHLYSAIILQVSSIPGLRTLSLDLFITQNQKDLPHLLPPPIRHSDIQNVRVLSVRCRGMDNDTAVQGLMESLTAKHPLRELEILKFDLELKCPGSHIGSLIQSAISAYMIHVSARDKLRILPGLKRQPMPRLQFLKLPLADLYNCISAPNLRQLTLTNTNRVFTNRDSLEIDAAKDLQKIILPASVMDYVGISNQSSWNCKSIEFTYDTCPEDITPLSRLEFVEFSPEYHRGTGVNEFLLKMLENPDACPRLHTITTSDYYPLWELLFEVLRRRNSSGVQRIAQICLPHLPILQLLWRLVRLLSGETSIFTYRDVDEVIEKRIECPEILCCLRCTQAGYVSCINHSQSPRYGEVDPSDLQNLLDLDYPRDKGFIAEYHLLDRWREDRVLGEYDNQRADNRERDQCDAYYRGCTVFITQHTLEGMSIPPWISTSEM